MSLEALATFEVVVTHPDLVLDAHELANAEQLSWLAALIAEAALRSYCEILYSDDFNHRQRLNGRLLEQNPYSEG